MDIRSTGKTGISRKGFASLTPERRSEIARMGGLAVPAERRSFSQNHDLARDAGRRGGAASKGSRKTDQ